MARVIYGAMITSLHGSLGGHTFQGNKFGNTIKSKSMPSGASTSSQFSNQNSLSRIAQLWRTLSTNDQTNWANFASTYPVYPVGSTTALSGFQIFCRNNIFRASIGIDPLITIVFESPVTTDFDPIIKVDGIDVMQIYFNQTVGVTGNIYSLVISQSLANLSAVSQFKRRVVGQGQAFAPSTEVGISYLRLYGKLPAVGNWLRLEIREFSVSIPLLTAPKVYYVQVEAL